MNRLDNIASVEVSTIWRQHFARQASITIPPGMKTARNTNPPGMKTARMILAIESNCVDHHAWRLQQHLEVLGVHVHQPGGLSHLTLDDANGTAEGVSGVHQLRF